MVIDEDFIFFFNAVPNVLKESKKVERSWLNSFPNGQVRGAHTDDDLVEFVTIAQPALESVARVFKEEVNYTLRMNFAKLISQRARTHPWAMVTALSPECFLYSLVFAIALVFAGLSSNAHKGLAVRKRKSYDADRANNAVSSPLSLISFFFFLFLNRN